MHSYQLYNNIFYSVLSKVIHSVIIRKSYHSSTQTHLGVTMAPGSTVSFVFPIGKLSSEQRIKFELALIKRREINPDTFEIDFDDVIGEHTVTAYPNPNLRINSQHNVSHEMQCHKMVQKLVAEALTKAVSLKVSTR